MGGLYTCTVTNDKPSSASATYTVQGASDTVLQLYPNALEICLSFKCCIHISWDYASDTPWNLAIMDTIGESQFVCYREVSLVEKFDIFLLL